MVLGPGYGPQSRSRIKEEELRQGRDAASDDDGLDLARDLDAEAVERRAEERRHEREAAARPDEHRDSRR